MSRSRQRARGTVGNGTGAAFALALTLQSYFTLGSSHHHTHDPRESRIWAELVSCHLLLRNALSQGCIYHPVKGTSLPCFFTFAVGQECCRWVFSAEELVSPISYSGLCLGHMFALGLFSVGTKLKFQNSVFVYFLM